MFLYLPSYGTAQTYYQTMQQRFIPEGSSRDLQGNCSNASHLAIYIICTRTHVRTWQVSAAVAGGGVPA